MRYCSIVLTATILFLNLSESHAAPADSLYNVITWDASAGGNGHTYAILKMTITWDSARIIVPALTMSGVPGNLASITSQAENDFIFNNLVDGIGPQPVLAQQLFLGGDYQNSAWVWLTGEPFSYANWTPGEPNNVGIETAISMWSYDPGFPGRIPGMWNNTLPNLALNPYIRQWSIVEWNQPKLMNSFVLPNPMFAAMQHPVEDIFASFYAGNFPGLYTSDDVAAGTILVNGIFTPASVEIVSHSLFEGAAIKVNVRMQDFLNSYGILWDTTTQNFMVTGSFSDQSSFSIEATFKSIGHISGDLNRDGRVNAADMTFMINRIFRGGPLPAIPQIADVDGSCGAVNVQDLTYLINSIYRGGPAPTHCAQ